MILRQASRHAPALGPTLRPAPLLSVSRTALCSAPRPARGSTRELSSTPSTRRSPISVPTGPGSTNPPDFSPPIEYEPFDRGLPFRRALLLFSIPVPPQSWPSHAELMCPLFGTVQFSLKSSKIGLNVIYDGTGTAKDLNGVETLPAELVYPDGKVFTWTEFTEETLDSPEFGEAVRYTAALPGGGAKGVLGEVGRVMVCTHGARDCRCSERGGPLVQSLRDSISNSDSELEVVEIAHVGGHKWAANALLYPSLDMFSNLSASDAEKFLRFIESGGEEERRMWSHWRGRIGYNDLVQMQLGMRVDRLASEEPKQEPKQEERKEEENESLDSAESTPESSGSTATTRTKAASARTASDPLSDPFSSPDFDPFADPLSGLDTAAARAKWKGKPTVPLTFTTFSGAPLTVSAPLGASLLEVARLNDLPGMEGTCGGNCECATCHLHFKPDWIEAPVEEPGEEEEDMLFTALGYRDGESRLGCQIRVTEELARWNQEGGVLKLPQY